MKRLALNKTFGLNYFEDTIKNVRQKPLVLNIMRSWRVVVTFLFLQRAQTAESEIGVHMIYTDCRSPGLRIERHYVKS